MSHDLEVGHPLPASLRDVPIEGARAFRNDGSVIVAIGFEDPTPEEVSAVALGPTAVTAFVLESALGLVVQCGPILEVVAWMAPDASDSLETDSTTDLPLRVVLFDPTDGIALAVGRAFAPGLQRFVLEHEGERVSSTGVADLATCETEYLTPQNVLDGCSIQLQVALVERPLVPTSGGVHVE